jgi:hypothetical protein
MQQLDILLVLHSRTSNPALAPCDLVNTWAVVANVQRRRTKPSVLRFCPESMPYHKRDRLTLERNLRRHQEL